MGLGKGERWGVSALGSPKKIARAFLPLQRFKKSTQKIPNGQNAQRTTKYPKKRVFDNRKKRLFGIIRGFG
jgi:hypothetical protein